MIRILTLLHFSVNGLRIKTDATATGSTVSNVVYSNNKLSGITQFGVLIDQSYPSTLGTPGTGVVISVCASSSISSSLFLNSSGDHLFRYQHNLRRKRCPPRGGQLWQHQQLHWDLGTSPLCYQIKTLQLADLNPRISQGSRSQVEVDRRSRTPRYLGVRSEFLVFITSRKSMT
jgi:hypothetical protein